MEFSPVVYEHAAALIGKSPWIASRDPAIMLEAHSAAYLLYGHSPIVAGIDIYNLEPEAYGSVLEMPDGNAIPAITAPLLSSLDELAAIPHFDPTSHRHRIPDVLSVGVNLKTRFPDADVRIPISGPFSIAGNLLGFETLLIHMIADPQKTLAALNHLVDGQLRFIREISRVGLGVSFFESGASPPMVPPAFFTDVVLPALANMITRATQILQKPIPCIIGGDTFQILDQILETGTKYIICPAETDQSAFMNKIRDRTDVSVRVNMSPSIIAHGSWDEIQSEVDRILILAEGRKNTSLGTGPLPYETPPENVLRIRDYLA